MNDDSGGIRLNWSPDEEQALHRLVSERCAGPRKQAAKAGQPHEPPPWAAEAVRQRAEEDAAIAELAKATPDVQASVNADVESRMRGRQPFFRDRMRRDAVLAWHRTLPALKEDMWEDGRE
jgi:hypothetical protein